MVNNNDLINELRIRLNRLDALESHYARKGKCNDCKVQDVSIEEPKCKNCNYATVLAIVNEGAHPLKCCECGCKFVLDLECSQEMCLECESKVKVEECNE